jgi:Holliday junction DNA helicase RuvA
VLGPDEVRRAVAGSDLATLTKVPGIGRKGAERLVVELRDRMGPPTGGAGEAAVPASAEPTWRVQVRSGLAGLGWAGKEVETALDTIAAEADGGVPDVSAALRQAIRLLGRR